MISAIETRIGIFTILAGATLLTVGLLSYQRTEKLIEANSEVTRTNEILTEISAVRAAMQGAQNKANDYIITQDEQFHDQYYSEVAKSQRALEILRRLTVREPGPQQRLNQLDPLMENAFQVFHVGMNPFPGMELTQKEVAQHRLLEQETMNGVRTILQEIENSEHRLLDQRNATAAAEARNTKTIVFLGSLLALFILSMASTVLHRDIAQRRKAEAALRDSEARYRTIFESAGDAILLIKKDILIDCSSQALELFRCQRQQLVGKTLADLSPPNQPSGPDSTQQINQQVQNAMTGAMLSFEWRFRRADETWFDSDIVLRPLNVRGEPYLFGIVTDITAHKQTEAENVRLAAAIEQSAEGVMITDKHGDILYVNPAFTSITGFTREEGLGRNPRILKSGKQSLEFYRDLWVTILRGESWHGELVNRRKDESLYTAQMSVAPVRETQNEITHFIATMRDITERKSLEAQLRQSQKMEAVGQLAGGVAHDFNNLLTIISGYGNLLEDRLNAQDRAFLDEIIKASNRAAALTRQLLAFSRRQILSPQVLDLNLVVANLERLLRRLIGEDIELATVQQRDLGRVKADSGQIEQVVINLAVNARDAMPRGGKLTIETANVELDESYVRAHTGATAGPHVMLAMSDTGVGMTPEVLQHIFEPFFTTKEKGKGTGLGLATAYGIVKQSSGSIWVYSEPNRGTTFKIYLPRFDELLPDTERRAERLASAGGSETILVVEDEDGVRSLVCAMLKSKGYHVLEARDAVEALSFAQDYALPIHVVLADVVMPKMSGKELADRIGGLHPEAQIIYVSGYTDDAVVRHGILEASTFFIQKPFTPNALVQKVRDVLDRKEKLRS